MVLTFAAAVPPGNSIQVSNSFEKVISKPGPFQRKYRRARPLWPGASDKEQAMLRSPIVSSRLIQPLAAVATAFALMASPVHAEPSPAAASAAAAQFHAEGVLRLRSNHGVPETVERVKAAVAAKGVRFFDAIDQAQLGAGASLTIRPSTLVLFGNPPLGVQFLQANPYAGLDWPVRMLVLEEADGSVWLAWSDFAFIEKRYGIGDKAAQFKMASEVAAAIAADAAR